MRALLLPVIVATLQPSAPAAAQERTETFPAIDEAQLLEKLAGDPRLARVSARIETARAGVVAARIRPNPTASYDREQVFPDDDSLTTQYWRILLPLEISGRRGARADAAQAEVQAIAAEGDATRFALTMQALRAFRAAAYERARVDLLRAERTALVAAVEIVRKRTAAGAASGYDLQRIQLELARYDDSIADAEAQLGVARLELGSFIGAPDGVDAAGALEVPAEPPAMASLLADVTRRPDYRATTARLEAADRLDRAAGRAWIPDLALTAGYMTQDIEVRTRARGYTAALGLSIPLFDHGQADRARARAQRRSAQAERQVIERLVPAAVRARHQTLTITLARARAVAREQLAPLPQLLRSAETAYREGTSNVIELLDAYTTARDTRLRDLDLRREAALAQIDLWLALGRRL